MGTISWRSHDMCTSDQDWDNLEILHTGLSTCGASCYPYKEVQYLEQVRYGADTAKPVKPV